MATQAPPELEQAYRSMRQGAAVVDRAAGVLEVSGPDAVEFLQGQVTNDVAAVGVGGGCYALLLNPKGRILADMRVLARAPDLLWLQSERLEAVLADLQKYRIGRQVEVSQRAATVLSVIGPRAWEVVALEPSGLEDAFVEGEINGAHVIAVATDLGVDLLLDPGHTARVRDHLAQRGGEPATEEAAEIRRIETGRPRYGADMTDQNLPGELGLEARAVSFTKGCYVGQEPVARMHYKGHPNRHLRGLELSHPAAAGQALKRDGNVVGTVTSVCASPALGPIALGLVRREAGPGEQVELQDGKARATVIELPFESH